MLVQICFTNCRFLTSNYCHNLLFLRKIYKVQGPCLPMFTPRRYYDLLFSLTHGNATSKLWERTITFYIYEMSFCTQETYSPTAEIHNHVSWFGYGLYGCSQVFQLLTFPCHPLLRQLYNYINKIQY